MTINELRNTLAIQPFRAFTVNTANGRSLQVPHPDFISITGGGRTVIIGSLVDDSFAVVDLLLVTRLDVSANGLPADNSASAPKP